MTFNVRVFGHRGTRQLHQVNPVQFTGNISQALVQPYDWAQVVTTAGATPVNTLVVGPTFGFNDQATLVLIEVPDGQTIRYEFNVPNRSGAYVVNGIITPFLTTGTPAGTNSPSLSGKNIFDWIVGTTISIVEAASFP